MLDLFMSVIAVVYIEFYSRDHLPCPFFPFDLLLFFRGYKWIFFDCPQPILNNFFFCYQTLSSQSLACHDNADENMTMSWIYM